MALGLAYDSDGARALTSAVTALMTGHAYATSARIAARMGPFAGFHENAEPMVEAVALARRVPHLIEHAGACEDAAHLLAQNGHRDEAGSLLTEALARYEDAGADAWAGRIRAQLRGLGVRRGARGPRPRPVTGWESLTATERMVSLLVAEGLTNGSVARRLYVSPHTVNTHLRHVFAKLGVSNRVALAAVVHRSIE